MVIVNETVRLFLAMTALILTAILTHQGEDWSQANLKAPVSIESKASKESFFSTNNLADFTAKKWIRR